MSVKRIDRGRRRVPKTWEDRAIEFEEAEPPELPLICKFASALTSDGWKTYIKVPNKEDGFPTLIVKNTSKRRKREQKQVGNKK